VGVTIVRKPEFAQLEVSIVRDIPVITLQRPEKLNALNTELFKEIKQVVEWLAETSPSLGLVLTGSGRGFIAGADLSEYADSGSVEFREFQKLGETVYGAIRDSRQIIVAAVNGFALGGGMEMVLACDVAFASEKARIGLPEIGVGLLPGGGGTVYVRAGLPTSVMKDLILSGRLLGSDEALRRGLVQYVCAHEDLLGEAVGYVETLNSRSPNAVEMIKKVLEPRTADLDARLEHEHQALMALFEGSNGQEGVRAFLEKRDPVYTRSLND
jgi:enoyl-CoA hydratase/carnithine racemase